MSFNDVFKQCPDSEVQSNLKALNEHLSPSNDNEQTLEQCYYTSGEFNSLVKANYSNNELNSKFTCFHFNCRSLPKNFDALTSFLSSLVVKSCIIGLTETWLNDMCSQNLYNIENYSFINNGRKEKRGGGVGMYIRNDIIYERRLDLDMSNESSESIFTEIDIGNHKF